MSASLSLASYRQPGGEADTRPEAYPRDLDELHTRLVRWFEESETATREGREASERDIDYCFGKQWTPEEMEALRKRGQPAVVINNISRKIALLCGLERKARTDPKAFPRTPQEDERADAATQALRYVCDENQFSVQRSGVYWDMLVPGCGGVELSLIPDPQTGGADIGMARVGWERIWYDPHSRDGDFSDVRYLGTVIWSDKDELEERFADAADVIGESFAQVSQSSYADRPSVMWVSSTRDRVRVCQCHWQERGEWWTAIYTRTGYLAEPSRSPFKDRHGDSAPALILQSAYVDRDNNRFGAVRDLIGPQDEINKRRSKALHLLSVRQVIADEGAVEDVDAARREVAKPDGYITKRPGAEFKIEQTADLAQGQFRLLEHATAEMQLSGPNAAMSGTDPRELSGRAILAQQAGGATQNEPLADALRQWARRVYEAVWMACREYWTGPRWLRVTDSLGSMRWVGINRPVTVADELAAMDEQQRAMVMQRLQIMPGDPRLQQVLRVENDISDLDVDITIQEGIDIPALAAEDFQSLIQLANLQPGSVPLDILIQASSLRNKGELLERLKQHEQAQAQQQAKMAPIAEAHAAADIRQKQAKAAADEALAAERQHGAIESIARVHQVHREMLAPPDAPSDPGTAMPADGQPQGMDLSHSLADLATKGADLQNKQADTAAKRAAAFSSFAKGVAALRPPMPPRGGGQ